jgi:hypothetical protein
LARQCGKRNVLRPPENQSALPVEIPGTGEQVVWSGRIRADLPQYVFDQLHEAAHRQRRTQVSMLLQLMADHRDADGNQIFFIRPEDLVSDRRKPRLPVNTEPDSPTHTEVQGWLRDLGWALGYDVSIGSNDRNRPLGSGTLGDGCLPELPDFGPGVCAQIVQMIDVLWLDKVTGQVVAGFEVENTTSIASGIVRLLTLAFGPQGHAVEGLFIAAPDWRETEVRTQSSYSAFRLPAGPELRYLSYGELQVNRQAIGRSGAGVKAVQGIGRALP